MDSKRAGTGTTLSLNLNIEPQDNNHETTGSELMEELNRMSSENKKLTETLFFLCQNYSSLQGQLMDFMGKDSKNCQYSNSKKRNAQGENLGCGINGNIEGRSCGGDGGGGSRPREIIKTNVSRVFVQTLPSDTTLVVKDGYQWRKYGQKVTRDNPSPRAYYKCSFAPNCPVKKKVQRSVEDPSLLVAIYEGEHNHMHPHCQAEVALGFNQLGLNIPNSTTISSSPSPSPNSNLESMKATGPMCSDAERPSPAIDMPAFQQLLVEKMANSLTGNPSFTTALAAAISTRILDHDISESWENTI